MTEPGLKPSGIFPMLLHLAPESATPDAVSVQCLILIFYHQMRIVSF